MKRIQIVRKNQSETRRRTSPFIILGIIIVPIAMITFPLAAEEDALSIIRKMEERQSVDTSKSISYMLVYPDAGDLQNHRDYKLIAFAEGDDNSYMEFLEPRTIRGLKILSRDGDQWVYFPSTGRVRKIAGKSKNESVRGVGGDFSYEDLSGGKIEEKYTFSVLSSSGNAWVLEGIPKARDSVYSRMLITVDKTNYLARKIEYYNVDEGHYKDLLMADVKTMGGRELPTKMSMINHEKQSMTIIITTEAQYNVSVDDKYFNPNRFYK